MLLTNVSLDVIGNIYLIVVNVWGFICAEFKRQSDHLSFLISSEAPGVISGIKSISWEVISGVKDGN